MWAEVEERMASNGQRVRSNDTCSDCQYPPKTTEAEEEQGSQRCADCDENYTCVQHRGVYQCDDGVPLCDCSRAMPPPLVAGSTSPVTEAAPPEPPLPQQAKQRLRRLTVELKVQRQSQERADRRDARSAERVARTPPLLQMRSRAGGQEADSSDTTTIKCLLRKRGGADPETDPSVDDALIGPDGNPLVTHGTVTIVFTMSGHAFRHEFLVVEGGNLLLLGNDFIGRYRASICPFDEDEQGSMAMSVIRQGTRHRIKIPLSCAPRAPTVVAAVTSVTPLKQPTPVKPPPEDDSTAFTEMIEGSLSEHPSLVPIDDPPTDVTTATATGPNEHMVSQMITDEYLLYCKQAITLPARTEVTVWLPVPLAHKDSPRGLVRTVLPK